MASSDADSPAKNADAAGEVNVFQLIQVHQENFLKWRQLGSIFLPFFYSITAWQRSTFYSNADLLANPKCALLVAKDPDDRTDIVITVHADAVPVGEKDKEVIRSALHAWQVPHEQGSCR